MGTWEGASCLRSHLPYHVWGQVQGTIDSLQLSPGADGVQLLHEREAEPEVLSEVDSSVPETLGAPETPTLQL